MRPKVGVVGWRAAAKGLMGLLLFGQGCAASPAMHGGAEPAKSTSPQARGRLSDAQQALARAEADLKNAAVDGDKSPMKHEDQEDKAKPTEPGNRLPAPPTGAQTAAPTQATPPPAVPSNAQAGGDAKAQEAETRTQGGCAMACRALASMKRAAETICEITGEADDRCMDARRRVEENTKKTTRCGCQ